MKKIIIITLLSIFCSLNFLQAQTSLTKLIPQTAVQKQATRPWVFWYWMQGAVSKEGITADLEAMKEAGIGGAYLMPIKGPAIPPTLSPAVAQLTPEWWKLVKFSMSEAARLGLEMGMHVSDGFALAGGPWITPALSMQKVVFSSKVIKGNQLFSEVLPLPAIQENYYKDIRVLAYRVKEANVLSTNEIIPVVTSSKAGINAQVLVKETNKESVKLDEKGWIQYAFSTPFLARTVTIKTGGNNYQAQRLLIETSNDGEHFTTLTRLEAPRHGWQDTDADVTHSIPPVSAKYFRFVFDKSGSEAGSEDLDAAKWKPVLKIQGLTLSSEAMIHQYEGKTGEVWRVSKQTNSTQVADSLCVPLNGVINLTDKLDAQGKLTWQVPAGTWKIVRLGHTSTGHTNATGGAAKGLECDKFNPVAVRLQFDKWFGEAQRQLGEELSKKALKVFHVDSWECGSQNWSENFAAEFKKRRGYELMPYLLVMAGIPVESRERSEQVLYDVRQTISELVVDKFYGTLATLAKEKGVSFTAESIAPTMTSDGLAHYKLVDVPMGEFWLNSPTHDKPNDMLDAISAAHIYGKRIIQAEGFTTVRMAWNEHPAMLKTLQDRNYALGINKLVYHVFTHNPWMDKQPGMTLDGVGLYFQRDQTWWKPAKAWVEYAQRCQTLLQEGSPVVDIAVFTGDEVPRRSVLPDRLVGTLTGLYDKDLLQQEQQRLANVGEPMRQIPSGVSHSANMADPEKWVNALRGYAYDSFNPDALANSAKVINGKVQFTEGTAYPILVFPSGMKLNPNSDKIAPKTLEKLLELVNAGATLLVGERPKKSFGKEVDKHFDTHIEQLWGGVFSRLKDGKTTITYKTLGKGKVIRTPFEAETFDKLGVQRDVIILDSLGNYAKDIAWTHRRSFKNDSYFIANQQAVSRTLSYSFRCIAAQAMLYNPVTDELSELKTKQENGRTLVSLTLAANESAFILFFAQKQSLTLSQQPKPLKQENLAGAWKVRFDSQKGGPQQVQTFEQLSDWATHPDSLIRYYSGTAIYSKNFVQQTISTSKRYWLDLGKVVNIASVRLNGVDCGVAWTAPYRVEITQAIRVGENKLEISVSNTWVNRLIGDHRLPEKQQISHTTAPYRLEGRALEASGLLGGVSLWEE